MGFAVCYLLAFLYSSMNEPNMLPILPSSLPTARAAASELLFFLFAGLAGAFFAAGLLAVACLAGCNFVAVCAVAAAPAAGAAFFSPAGARSGG